MYLFFYESTGDFKMITARSSLPKDITSAALPEGTLFFDIETTGFSPDSSHLYMIGCSFIQDGVWQIIQWFDETKTDAGERLHLLRRVCRLVRRFHGRRLGIPGLSCEIQPLRERGAVRRGICGKRAGPVDGSSFL